MPVWAQGELNDDMNDEPTYLDIIMTTLQSILVVYLQRCIHFKLPVKFACDIYILLQRF